MREIEINNKKFNETDTKSIPFNNLTENFSNQSKFTKSLINKMIKRLISSLAPKKDKRIFPQPWKPTLSLQEVENLKKLRHKRIFSPSHVPCIPSTSTPTSTLTTSTTPSKIPSKSINLTLESLKLLINKEKTYVKILLNTRPYILTKNDIFITKDIKAQVGDIISLENIKEVGGNGWFVRNTRLDNYQLKIKDVNSKENTSKNSLGGKGGGKGDRGLEWVDVKAVVLEKGYSAKYTILRRRVGKGGGDRKFRKRSYRDKLTVLRLVSIEAK